MNNELANPETPVNHWCRPSTPGNGTGASTGMTKLEVVASQQLAALVTAVETTDWTPSMRDSDMVKDNEGRYHCYNGVWRGATTQTPSSERYSPCTTMKQRVVREAIEYATELLEQLR